MKAGTTRTILPVNPPPAPRAAGLLEAFEEVRVLTGHSGARVTLCKRGAASIVRKCAASSAGNARLMRQADKQRSLAAHGLAFPRVIAQGTDASGVAYFEMEYVPARTLAATIAMAGSYDRAAVLSAVDNMLWLFRRAATDEIPAETFTGKIDDIAANCARHAPTIPHLAAIEGARGALNEKCWTGIPASPSHGDLTLENILISARRGIVFIDCDEPFASSFWLDAGKLFQDICGYWCLRHMLAGPSAGADVLNAIQKLEKLGFAMRAVFAAADAALPRRLPQLAALSLFRTLPYAQDEDAVCFVLARIRHILGLTI